MRNAIENWLFHDGPEPNLTPRRTATPPTPPDDTLDLDPEDVLETEDILPPVDLDVRQVLV